MTPFYLLIVILSESCTVAGQILFKFAMGEKWGKTGKSAWPVLFAGVAAMAVAFFLWLGLLPKFHLSLLYAFEALNRIVLLLSAVVFLKEKVTLQLWLGSLLILTGVWIVAHS